MIKNIDEIKSVAGLSNFQTMLLEIIGKLLLKIKLNDLSSNSYIDVKKELTTVALIHREDFDTKVVLNLFENHLTLGFGPCDIYLDNYNGDFNSAYFKDIYDNCLLGKYKTTTFYLGKKPIFSSTNILNSKNSWLQPHTFFYRFYTKFYSKRFVSVERAFKSFI